jgi:hypothetical protein
VSGPLLVNCPSDSSRKKIGIPTNTNMMMYGMKNTAETNDGMDNMSYKLNITI